MPALITLADAKAHSRIDTDDEDAIIQAKVDKVAVRIQQMIDDGLRARRSVFF